MSFYRGAAYALPFSLAAWALVAGVAVVSCRTPEPRPPIRATRGVEMPQPRPLLAAASDASSARDVYGRHGRFRVVHRTACRSGFPNPLVWPDRYAAAPGRPRPPAAGEPLRVEWTTEGTVPPFPASPVFLLVSLGDTGSIELGPGTGLAGCSLHVSPNPRNLFAFAPASVPWLTQVGGVVRLTWTPPAVFAGVEVNMQAVVYAPEANAAGWLLSPGLELWVGRGDT